MGPGATLNAVTTAGRWKVSILARLWGRALLLIGVMSLSLRYVSILARLWGRALRSRRPLPVDLFDVSILARLWGRALQPINAKASTQDGLFQSSPGFGAGRYLFCRCG
ncbi:hypothetical protein, partial [Nitrosomonas sp.]|uniref:hypothetical protein n=1 Tax=Nitrosomonas sp. TaxID=42353 RepID=UPI003A5BA637